MDRGDVWSPERDPGSFLSTSTRGAQEFDLWSPLCELWELGVDRGRELLRNVLRTELTGPDVIGEPREADSGEGTRSMGAFCSWGDGDKTKSMTGFSSSSGGGRGS
jgi:hypothetical protein